MGSGHDVKAALLRAAVYCMEHLPVPQKFKFHFEFNADAQRGRTHLRGPRPPPRRGGPPHTWPGALRELERRHPGLARGSV